MPAVPPGSPHVPGCARGTWVCKAPWYFPSCLRYTGGKGLAEPSHPFLETWSEIRPVGRAP